jgi:hypothetical protein
MIFFKKHDFSHDIIKAMLKSDFFQRYLTTTMEEQTNSFDFLDMAN